MVDNKPDKALTERDELEVLDRLRAYWRKYLSETEEGRQLIERVERYYADAAADAKESE